MSCDDNRASHQADAPGRGAGGEARRAWTLARSPTRGTPADAEPPPCGLLGPSRSGVGLSLLGCGLLGGAYTPVGESIEPVRRKARAGVGSEVSGLQQFIDQAIAFAPARVHAYADCRSTHSHVWGGLPKDLPSHVLQHPKSLLAHLPNTLHHGLCTD